MRRATRLSRSCAGPGRQRTSWGSGAIARIVRFPYRQGVNGTAPSLDELLRRGREAMAARRYAEARDLFDEALRTAPDDPRVQALAVTAEFWRRLARDGDGFGPPLGPPPNARGKPGGAGSSS
jgi:hypothetical protein